jgi:8-oxo-dGTP pyrophosphatase MutT (NUDIX family)
MGRDTMSSSRRCRPIVSVGLIERYDNAMLVVCAEREAEPPTWRFPSGTAEPHESPEAAMRRFAREDLGIGVEIVVGQPPTIAVRAGTEIELRHFFCGLADGEVQCGRYARFRWVERGELADLRFDDLSAPIVEWLLGST